MKTSNLMKFYNIAFFTANLIITIMDENDQKPVFTNGPNYTASIRENIPVGTLIKFDGIAGIVVKDKDVDVRISTFYHILSKQKKILLAAISLF